MRPNLKRVPNQGTEGTCTAQALCNIINSYKNPKYQAEGLEWEELDGQEFFDLVNSKYPPELQGGLTPHMALEYAKEQGLIRDYMSLTGKWKLDQLKKAVKSGYYLLVVMNRVDRNATHRNGSITLGTGGLPHTLAILQYNEQEDKFLVVNSRGEERGNGGYCWLPAKLAETVISQLAVVIDSDDKGNMNRLLYKNRIRSCVKTISDQWQYGNEAEKKAMNFANTMLRKVVLGQDHQYNMSKAEIIKLINQYF